jgi:hypothetical protein
VSPPFKEGQQGVTANGTGVTGVVHPESLLVLVSEHF